MPSRSSEQKAAEAEVEHFREELGPFVIAAEETRMAMVFTDAKADGDPIIFANDSFLELRPTKRLGTPSSGYHANAVCRISTSESSAS